MGSYNVPMWVVAMAVVAAGMTSFLGEADEPTPSCAQDLVPCGDYLNNTNPPAAACCTAIKETVATKLPCLCNLFFTPGLLETFGGNASSGIRIATACGETMDVAQCKALTGAAPTESPPATPGVPGGNGSGSGRLEWTGFSALVLFWASAVMFY